jgi:O-methyltransferase
MLARKRYILNLELALRVRGLQGAVAECGTWRGGMIAGMAQMLGSHRTYHLFDSFEGLPPPGERDGEKARAWANDRDGEHFHDNCTASEEEARLAMERAGVPDYHLHPGWFEDTLPGYDGGPLALLRIDADWYASTLTCLSHLFPQVAVGGLIVFDDYYTWVGCSQAVHEYLARHRRPERVRQYKNTVAYLVKSSDTEPPPASA